MTRIAVDLAGSEKGAHEVIAGAKMALQEKGLEITLVGDPKLLKEEDFSLFSFVPAPLAIPTTEKVSRELLRNSQSSLFQIVRLVKEGKVDAAVSGGNTACFVALATSLLGTIPGVDRPGIAIFLPKTSGSTILIDAGANTACVSHHLVSYAIMGSALSQAIFEIKEPRVGLLNVGSEGNKGNDLYRETYNLLKEERRINFVGNVEGYDLFKPDVDVAVVDGFTGNCLLKAAEGVAEDFAVFLKEEFLRKNLSQNEAVLEIQSRFERRADFAEYSGGFLMGVPGICVIIHGRSGAEAHRKAIIRARDAVEHNLILKLKV